MSVEQEWLQCTYNVPLILYVSFRGKWGIVEDVDDSVVG